MKRQRKTVLVVGLFLTLSLLLPLNPWGARHVGATSGMGGFSMDGCTIDHVYYYVDELYFRVDLELGADYAGWIRILDFDDWGNLANEETWSFNWDVTQAGDIILDGIGTMYVAGDYATLYPYSGIGLGESWVITLQSWDSIEQSMDDLSPPPDEPYDEEPYYSDDEYEDEDWIPDEDWGTDEDWIPEEEYEPEEVWTPEETEPADVAPPVAPVLPPDKTPTTEEAAEDAQGEIPYVMPPDAKPVIAPTPEEQAMIEAQFEDRPELAFSQGFSFIRGVRSYYANLPRIYDSLEETFYLDENAISQLLPRSDTVKHSMFSDGTVIARFTNLSPYPIAGGTLIYASLEDPSVQVTLTSNALCMPGQTSQNFHGRLESATSNSATNLQLQAMNLCVMDKFAGLAYLRMAVNEGTIELDAYYPDDLKLYRVMDQVDLDNLSAFLGNFQVKANEITLVNTFNHPLIGIELHLDHLDGIRQTLFLPTNVGWRVDVGATSTISEGFTWKNDIQFDAGSPFVASQVTLVFEAPSGEFEDAEVWKAFIPLEIMKVTK